jgi:ADP-ribose pyrophosphatase YjhB (NUDIX family)
LEEALFSRYGLIEAAGGVVRNKKDKVLMMFRKGKWDLPKGKIDLGETIKQAAKREITEETGVRKLKIIRQIRFFNGKQDCTYHSYMLNGKRVIKATYWYEMVTDDTSPLIPQLEENITVVGWFSKKEIREHLKNSYRSVQWVLNEYGLK